MSIYILGGTAAVALGAWLRWAVTPAVLGFRIGLCAGRIQQRRAARQP